VPAFGIIHQQWTAFGIIDADKSVFVVTYYYYYYYYSLHTSLHRAANPKIRQHALYTVVNILTGSETHKEAVATSNLPTLLLHHMRTSTSPEVRV